MYTGRRAELVRERAPGGPDEDVHRRGDVAASRQTASIFTIPPLYRVEQLLHVVAVAVLENDLDAFDIGNVLRRVALDHPQIRVFAHRDRPDAVLQSQEDRAVQGGDSNRVDGRKSGRDKKLELALIGEARKQSSVSNRIGS